MAEMQMSTFNINGCLVIVLHRVDIVFQPLIANWRRCRAIQSVLCNRLLLLINYLYVLACTHMIVKLIMLVNNLEIYINLLVYVNTNTKVREYIQ